MTTQMLYVMGGATPLILVVTWEFGEDIQNGKKVNRAQQTLPLSKQVPVLG